MISKKCKYALRAVFQLAVENNDSTKKNGKELAEELKIPTPYLGKILQELALKNIISSIKGPNGGFYLTEKNLQTSLIKIVEAIDGLSFFETCGLGLDDCSDDHPCPIHEDFKIVRSHLKDVFENKSIRELASEIKIKELILVR